MLNDLLAKARKQLYEAVHRSRKPKISSRFDTSDIVQEGLIQIWKESSAGAGTKEAVDPALIETISAGYYCKMMRFHFALKRSISKEESDSEVVDRLLDSMDSPSSRCAQDEFLELLLSHLERMGEQFREIFVRKNFFEQNITTIAADLGMNHEEVRSKYRKAVRYLRIAMADHE